MKRLVILVICFLLTSCASLRTLPPHSHFIPWPERQVQLNTIQNWRIHASVGIHTSQKSLMGNLIWHQEGWHFSALLFGPLGFGSARVTGSPQHFTLWKSANESYHAKNAETLMNQQLGWSLPVTNLFYWVRGLPLPKVTAKMQWDQDGHLIYLNQRGWKMYYSEFHSIKNIDLPTQIYLISSNARIKLVIQQWEYS